jgi:hypothetical protein
MGEHQIGGVTRYIDRQPNGAVADKLLKYHTANKIPFQSGHKLRLST